MIPVPYLEDGPELADQGPSSWPGTPAPRPVVVAYRTARQCRLCGVRQVRGAAWQAQEGELGTTYLCRRCDSLGR